ncbi:MAG: hypothetical protein HY319_10600 [Armatimonadetes bacterium]|nr:hypothetical protein [Armatimonadota bacterium]
MLLGRLVDALYTLRAVGTKLSRSGERVRQMLAKIRRKADAAASRAGNDFPLFEEREMLRAVFEACGCVDLDALSSMRPSVADLCTLEQLVFFCGRGGRIVNNAGVRYLFRDQRSGLEALARCASFAPSEVESTSATLGGTSGEMFRRQCVRARARAMRGRRG